MVFINTVVTILITVLLFGVVIFLHELGHFISAKLFGVKVNEFALGMGPKLITFGKKETKYSLRAFPIGGFCAMEGEDEASDDERAFNNKKVWKRIIIVIAGAAMNLILGFLLMIALTAQEDTFKSTTLAGVGQAVVIEDGELRENDKILEINGYRVFNDYDVNFSLSRFGGEPMDFLVQRDGEKVLVQGISIDFQQVSDKDKNYAFLVQPIEKNFFTVLGQAGKSTVSIARLVWASLGDLISGRYGMEALSGPVGTAEVIGQAAAQGQNFMESFNNIIWIMAIITVNLGIFNLLPIPALDGGRLLFLIIEGIRRKPVNPKYEGWVHATGFILLIGLMLVVTFNDIVKLFQ